MDIVHDSTLMRIYVAESERTRGKPTHLAIVEALKHGGVRGAIVFKGIEGYGSHRRISSATVVDGYVDLPILIEVIDDNERIAAFLPHLDELLVDGLVTLEQLQVTRFRASGWDT